MKPFFVALVCGSLALSVLDAAPRRVDLGKRSTLIEQVTEFDVDSPRPDMNTSLNGKTMQMKDWHGEYSSLGRKKSSLMKKDAPLNTDTKRMDRFEKKNVDLKVSSNSRRRATVRNWNDMKEQVMSHKFTHTELRTPESRRFQEMVDEISLQDVNRFQSMRNKTDDGIPVQRAASGEPLAVPEE
ncbi:hypothetical protein [Rubellicoccus peritrichatus]|uniref:Uncharacterized protein n=1 Tax=Rubellicoccus peritrichatus TaxID=3080537 RepID=A0AAQ3QXC0_9BACT|nr:hypothetical protein [Puniceicoccus sp. CR14]WOO42720.1 hypothetical protein RZN69_06425 [Puniceicoccus sp. CR14]